MTTKEIREKAGLYDDMPRTNKFKRAVDLALAQDLPIKILIAPPFRGYEAKLKSGETASFKVKIKNTRTGGVRFFGRCCIQAIADAKWGCYRGHNFGAPSFEWIDRMIVEKFPDVDLKAVVYTHTGEHSYDKVDSSIGWGSFARVISELFKKDFAHTEPCGKCSGSGFLPHYAHIDNGVCWDCCGSGQHLHVGKDGQKAAA
jgi:hypothetical protein